MVEVDVYTRDVILEIRNLWGAGVELGYDDLYELIGELSVDAPSDRYGFDEGVEGAWQPFEQNHVTWTANGMGADRLKDGEPLDDVAEIGGFLREALDLAERVKEAGRRKGRSAYAEAIRDHRDTFAESVEAELKTALEDPNADDDDRAEAPAWAANKVAGYDHALAMICARFEITLPPEE